jgi:hypothetical protein
MPALAGSERSAALGAILRRITTVLAEPSHGHWQFRMPGVRRAARVELSAEWLSISLSLRVLSKPMDCKLIGTMLSRNARIEGSPRIIGRRLRRQLVADIPVELLSWESESELETLVAATIASVGAALDASVQHPPVSPQAQLPREQLAAMFDEAEWPTRADEGDGLDVPLEVPGTYLAASVRHDGSSTRLSVPILVNELASAPYKCRSAVTVLLWLVASRVRMVKPTRSRRALGLEVSLPPGPVKAEALAHGCAALSAALQAFVTEAGLLAADECLAQTYLSNLGFQTPT